MEVGASWHVLAGANGRLHCARRSPAHASRSWKFRVRILRRSLLS